MAGNIQVPCDGDGVCMRCKSMPPPEESLTCCLCVTPWHVSCLSSPPETLASTLQWRCPDCSGGIVDPPPVSNVDAGYGSAGSDLVAAIRAIEADESLSTEEKAKKRQELVSGKNANLDVDDKQEKKKKSKQKNVLSAVGDNLICSFCMQLLEKPVSIPCGHNACLKCFEKWMGQGKRTCGKCRSIVPEEMARNPRINLQIEATIRLAKVSESADAGTSKVFPSIDNEDRPDTTFTTERAKKNGNANASGGRIYFTIPGDHFGPIPPENDPVRNKGLSVGDSWIGRHECRQWGAHFPQVGGIAGQAKHGAQSVVLAAGYEDDEDHGDWFLYTGSGGRDLSNNRRTNNEQSFDQHFKKANEALKLSCKLGYPVRVMRSNKAAEHSVYAPKKDKEVRYDGVYRIEKCWRKVGIQGSFKVCRFLFVRCDNEPAPWTSDQHGDRPRASFDIPELSMATDLFERTESPSWDFDEGESRWRWMKPPPASKMKVNPEGKRILGKAKKTSHTTVRAKLLKEFRCGICRKVMTLPVTTPCAHNFCKACLESKFAGKTLVKERSRGGRTLRALKNVMNCPCCPTDISDFLQNTQVNREVMEVIERLKNQEEDDAEPVDEAECSGTAHEEETLVVSKEDEQPKKRIKLDTDTTVSATVV